MLQISAGVCSFTTQLLELGIPVVVALNKSDIVNKKQTQIDEKLLSEKLGCPVIKTVSTSSGHEGLKEAVHAAAELKGKGQEAPYIQADIDLKDKVAVEAADRKRFEFVNGIVKQVEKERFLQKIKTYRIRSTVSSHIRSLGFLSLLLLSFLYSTYLRQLWVPGSQTGWWHGSRLSRAG